MAGFTPSSHRISSGSSVEIKEQAPFRPSYLNSKIYPIKLTKSLRFCPKTVACTCCKAGRALTRAILDIPNLQQIPSSPVSHHCNTQAATATLQPCRPLCLKRRACSTKSGAEYSLPHCRFLTGGIFPSSSSGKQAAWSCVPTRGCAFKSPSSSTTTPSSSVSTPGIPRLWVPTLLRHHSTPFSTPFSTHPSPASQGPNSQGTLLLLDSSRYNIPRRGTGGSHTPLPKPKRSYLLLRFPPYF